MCCHCYQIKCYVHASHYLSLFNRILQQNSVAHTTKWSMYCPTKSYSIKESNICSSIKLAHVCGVKLTMETYVADTVWSWVRNDKNVNHWLNMPQLCDNIVIPYYKLLGSWSAIQKYCCCWFEQIFMCILQHGPHGSVLYRFNYFIPDPYLYTDKSQSCKPRLSGPLLLHNEYIPTWFSYLFFADGCVFFQPVKCVTHVAVGW